MGLIDWIGLGADILNVESLVAQEKTVKMSKKKKKCV